ncbi:MAG: protein kinase [Muribaculaceae bacterium]|nr:protein kinase [Muribaculaceae bacterium]
MMPMDRKDYTGHEDVLTRENADVDSGIYTSEESGHLDLAGMFSSKFSNINLIYRSERGATEIHAATRYGKRFVLKGLGSEHRDDPVYSMCMAKEFEIGITLDHPNIRRTIGFENVDGLGKRIILEYIDGSTLAEILSTGGITPERASTIAVQIADAIRYLHGKQICHRDLKPENILITHKGDIVKVIDFNLSDRDDYIVLKNPAGSKRYMAPELADPDSAPTPETDYYSLGVIMKDLAEASGNRHLGRAAAQCMDNDPRNRRHGIAILEAGNDLQESTSLPDRILSSKPLTYILSAICIFLAAFIAYHYRQ